MTKTLYGPGVIVTSQWLNGAQRIHFDGIDEDWHFDPIDRNDILRVGEDGLDAVYITLETYQKIPGNKTFTGDVRFGDVNLTNPDFAPKSYNTNALFNRGGVQQSTRNRYDNLENYHLITKEILDKYNRDIFPVIDGGTY